MNFYNIISIASGPVIGAVIGYFTNYIAVKMLFRPRKEVRLLGVKLPFTPGIIPKRRAELAKAIGNTVGNRLLTKEAVLDVLLRGDAANSFAMEITNAIFESELSIGELSSSLPTPVGAKEKLSRFIAERLCGALSSFDMGNVIMREARPIIKENLGGIASMFVSDEMLSSFAEPINEKIRAYMREHIDDVITPAVSRELDELGENKLYQCLSEVGIENAEVFSAVRALYDKAARAYGEKLLDGFSVSEIIENKINEMDVREVEDMVISTMKRELDAVVRLGALVGFVLGLLNIVFK